MTKMYNEPEFKVVNMTSADVMTASADLPAASSDWDPGANNNGGGVSFGV